MPLNENDYGAFLPTTDVIDPQELYSSNLNPADMKNFLARLRQAINNISTMVNIKDTGLYDTTEFVCGQLYFPNPALTHLTAQLPTKRSVYRKVISTGALPNTGTTTTAHGITPTATFSFTRIYGCATDPTGIVYLPLPYASPVLANNIEVNVDVTNVNITTGSNRSAFTTSYVILEYIKQ